MRRMDEFSDILATCKSETRTTDLISFLQQMPYIRPNAPYQRNDIWKLPYKQQLIKSIVYCVPFGIIHLAEKKLHSVYKYVLDGKQRIEAINSFMGEGKCDNNFSVPIPFPDGGVLDVTYDMIVAAYEKRREADREKVLQQLWVAFHQYPLTIVDWKDVSIPQQCAIFNAINYSREMSTEERIYCPSFLARKIMDYVFETSLARDLSDSLESTLLRNKRMKKARSVHNVLILCFGENLLDQFAEREISKLPIDRSAKELHSRCIQLNISDHEEIDEDSLELLGIKNNIEKLRQATRLLRDILRYSPDGTKILRPRIKNHVVFDVICFFISKSQKNLLSFNDCQEKLDLFHALLNKFIEVKSNDAINSSSTIKTMVGDRQRALDKIAADLGLCQTLLNVPLLRSNCEMCGRLVDRTNGTGPNGILCDDCNDKVKRDISLKQAETISGYVENKV